MTKTDARAWLHLFGDTPDDRRQTCRHGHKECSTSPGGACLDDVLAAAITAIEAPPDDRIPVTHAQYQRLLLT